MIRTKLPLLFLLPLATACGAPATVDVTAYGEAYVEDRIPADDTVDGWEIVFDRFAVNLLDLGAEDADGREVGYLAERASVDLAAASDGAGHSIASGDVDAVADVLRVRVAPDDDTPALVVEGRAWRGDVEKTFAWSFDTETTYRCAPASFPLAPGDVVTAQLTMHADHLFYDDLDEDEPNVAFDLVAAADTDGDDVVTEEELRATDLAGQARYQVGSRDIDELFSFIAAQTRTLGHVDGEHHCDTE